MRYLLVRSLPGLALFLLANPLQADILFSQPVINGGVALASDFARSQQEADNFALSQPAAVQSIQWCGAYANNNMPADNFTLRFFADAAGNPAMTAFVNVSLASVTRTATNLLDNLGDPIYAYQATLPTSVLVDGATSYYVSLVNNTGDWDWVGSGPGTHWAGQTTPARGPSPATRPALPSSCLALPSPNPAHSCLSPSARSF